MSKKETLGINEFLNFLKYLDLAITFDIHELDESEYYYVASKIKEDNEIEVEDIINNFKNFEKIIMMDLYLPKNAFITTATELAPPNLKEKIINSQDIVFCISMTKTFFIVSLVKVHVKRSRKTIQELEVELDNAIKTEDYSEAIKLREKIKKLKDKK